MLQAAIHNDPAFELSQVDIDRPPPHYAVETVRILAQQFPGAELVYLMGGDSLHDLPEWYDPQGFVDAVDAIGVMHRPGDESIDLSGLEAQLAGLAAKVAFVDAPLLEIASSEIRERVGEGRHYCYYLPEAVYRYIIENGLYRDEQPEREL
jgi:nicotinate-nucleotide adenylyltransferase